jgi:hypothetical protein
LYDEFLAATRKSFVAQVTFLSIETHGNLLGSFDY